MTPLQGLMRYIAQRQEIDRQTRQAIGLLHARLGPHATPFQVWQAALAARQAAPNSVPLRNADHYLYSQFLHGAPSLLAPGYLIYKLLRSLQASPFGGFLQDPAMANASPDPWGQLKWGMLPLFERDRAR